GKRGASYFATQVSVDSLHRFNGSILGMVRSDQCTRAIKIRAIELEIGGDILLVEHHIKICRQSGMHILVEPDLHWARLCMVVMRPLLRLAHSDVDHSAIGLVSIVRAGAEILDRICQPLVMLFFIGIRRRTGCWIANIPEL